MSSSSMVTGLRGSSPRRSTSCMAFSSRTRGKPGRRDSAGTVPAGVLLGDLVQELVRGRTDALEPGDLRHRQIRVGDVPAFGVDLVAGEVVLRLRAADPRPAFEGAVQDVEVVGDLRREVVDVGVPLAVEGGAEQQLRVVV